MPFCGQCGAFHEPCGGPQPITQTKKNCPKGKGALMIVVQDDAGNNLGAVNVTKDGSGKNTDNAGAATWEGLDPGKYTVDLPPLSQQLKADYDPPKKTQRKETVKEGAATSVIYTLTRKAALKVKVVSKDGSTLFQGATVDGTGPETVAGKVTGANGIADCLKVSPGKYDFKIGLKQADEDDWATTLDFKKKDRAEITLAPGDDKELVVQVEKKNEVKPKLELEYCVVLLESKLHKKLPSKSKIFTSPTYVEVSMAETNKQDHPFSKGAKLECVPANVEVYLDEEMTKKASGGKLKYDDIKGDNPVKLYLKGVTEGKFKIKFNLDDPDDRFVKLKDNPTAEQDMGVAKLELKLHFQDMTALRNLTEDPDTNPEATYYTNLHNKVLPDQKLMTDDEKVGSSQKVDASKPGRLLHLQNGGNFGRAKVIMGKINAAHVPDAADAYEIVLNTGRGHSPKANRDDFLMGGAGDTPVSGQLAVYDLEFAGALQSPAKATIAALKAAEKTFWVEGTAETDRTCDVRLDMGMDRAAGGLAKTVKRNGDWGRFSVIQIKEVKVKYDAKAGKPNQWDAAQNRFYINLKKDPSGRNIDIEAELNKPFKNVELFFMLAPDTNNKKAGNWGHALPGTWTWANITKDVKHKDRKNRTDFLHLSEKTDDKGKAKKMLVLSRFGGDAFWPACYIGEDAHLAKYVDGDPNLGTKVPVRATAAVNVWRKFWTQLINVQGVPNPGVAGAIGQYDLIKADMAAATPKAMTTQEARDLKAIYPRYMIELNGGNADALVVSNKNKKKFFEGISKEADKPIKVPIVIADAQWDAGNQTSSFTSVWVAAAPVSVDVGCVQLKPPLSGGKLVVSGELHYRYDDPSGAGPKIVGKPVKLTDDMVDIDPNRNSLNKVRLTPPAVITGKAGAEFMISGMVLQGNTGPWLGESFDGKILSVYDPAEPADFQNTIVHELGHGFSQTVMPGAQASGIPNHPNQYNSMSQGISTGSHCNHNGKECVMYESGPQATAINRYCDVCHPYMLVHDMSKYGK